MNSMPRPTPSDTTSGSGSLDRRWKYKEDAADQNFDYMFKLLIIGNSSVGKTSFLFRFSDDTFSSAFVSTVGIDFKVKTIVSNGKRIKLQIWVSASISLLLTFHLRPCNFYALDLSSDTSSLILLPLCWFTIYKILCRPISTSLQSPRIYRAL